MNEIAYFSKNKTVANQFHEKKKEVLTSKDDKEKSFSKPPESYHLSKNFFHLLKSSKWKTLEFFISFLECANFWLSCYPKL